MLAAQQKRKENIVEYILYLYQVEDLIRAFKLKMPDIEEHLVTQYQVEEKTRIQITKWYKNLVLMMEKESIREKGHFQFLSNHINELNELHLKLMETEIKSDYCATFKSVSGLITELRQKGNNENNDLQISLDAVYGYLLLRMQKKEITVETEDALKRIYLWLGILAKLYKEFENGELDFEQK